MTQNADRERNFHEMVHRIYRAVPGAPYVPNPDGWAMWGEVEGNEHYQFAECIAREIINATRGANSVTEAQINYMVNRFLCWKLPENFNPDGGISFKRTFNEGTDYAGKNEPVGTNVFTAEQAGAMVRHMIEGLPA